MEKLQFKRNMIKSYYDFYIYSTMENVTSEDMETLLKIHDCIVERHEDLLENLKNDDVSLMAIHDYINTLNFGDDRINSYIYDNIYNDVMSI